MVKLSLFLLSDRSLIWLNRRIEICRIQRKSHHLLKWTVIGSIGSECRSSPTRFGLREVYGQRCYMYSVDQTNRNQLRIEELFVKKSRESQHVYSAGYLCSLIFNCDHDFLWEDKAFRCFFMNTLTMVDVIATFYGDRSNDRGSSRTIIDKIRKV